jgi:hypothetical protein
MVQRDERVFTTLFFPVPGGQQETIPMNLTDRYFAGIADCFTPEVAQRIVEFRPDAPTELRLDDLRRRANEGLLTEEEVEEYEAWVEVVDWIGVLKAHARAKLR